FSRLGRPRFSRRGCPRGDELATAFIAECPMRKLIFLALLPTMVVVGASSSEAASHYIRAGATGANDGSTWADAWTTFPSSTTYIRGDEYYVADGTYSGAFDFARGVSGTTTIKICKATISTVGRCSSAHGSDTGWQNTYGDGQALFPGTGVKFSTAYWIFDGVSGAGSRASTGSNPASYGFYFTPPNSGSTIRPVVYNANNIQVLHTAVTCPGASGNIQQFGYSGTGDAVTASQTYVNNCQVSHWNQGDDSVIENSYFGSHWSSSANHGVQVGQTVRPVFRNNLVNMCHPQWIEPAGDFFTGISNGQYYNNVFANVVGGNGVLKGVCDGAIVNTVMYGNTVINSEGPILYQNNEGRGTGSGNTVVNNLFYNCDAIINQSTG